MEKERFSMLLLDPGEIFFEDYSVQMQMIESSDNNESEWADGRLKFCSKSLVFVCKDLNKPLIKIPLKETTAEKYIIEQNSTRSSDILLVKCKLYVEMLEGNILAPHKFIHKITEFKFAFNYAKVDDCLPQILQLIRASTLPIAEQNAMILTIVHSRQSRFSFDTSWLEDLYEEVVCEVQANKVLPLIVNPGRILLTTCRIYFQPYNNIDQYPVYKINLKDVKSVTKRRFLLRQVGLEIEWIKPSNNQVKNFYIATKNQKDRDDLYKNILNQSVLKLDTVYQNHMTMQWQNGCLSNYDYLMYLNSLGDRTFHDLTQYPVMPWVIQDYTSSTLNLNDSGIYRDLSKPIGALEPERLERLKARFNEMSEPKFLYGSHYSAPGFVLFYLVRKYPQYMLCLQNGRFDHPDRMFNSISDVWKNVLVNMSDFKELIPEFYDPENGGDFLINNYGIDFGFRHDGTKIADVQLPPWAKGPADFIKKLRDALESDYVSKNLHGWIDLIFGYKQRGDEALKADNVFFHLCYEGAVDLDTITDINDRHGLEVQIMEFGQIPKQVFKLPHPKRLLPSDLLLSETLLSSTSSSNDNKIPTSIKKSIAFQSHKQLLSQIITIKDDVNGECVISVGHDGIMKMYSLKTGSIVRNVTLTTVPLHSCISYKTADSHVLVVGTSDNSLLFYDMDYGKIFDTLYGHEDVVSCLAYSEKHSMIVSSSWDCTTKVWHVLPSHKKIKPAECLLSELHHDSQVTCMNISRDGDLLATGTEDGDIFLWSLGYPCKLKFTVKEHASKINSIILEPESKNIITCANDKSLSVIDVQTSTQIFFTTLDEEPLSMTWIANSYLLIGDREGFLRLWDPQSAAFVFKITCHRGPLVTLATTFDNKKVITGGQDKKIIVWEI
ncbi:protein FAN-like [Trichogramma pretiosum]|uniref:protein FAN-like n=1 Tax=Trichogramma pretiosum TaxID=7493 RepID=UPI000C718DBF|nr:protein FAN-like [Trichogramma pretiosum]